MSKEFVYHDLLKEYIEGEVTKFVGDMGSSHPTELLETPKDKLIYGLTDRTTSMVRQVVDRYIDAAAYELTIGIRWAKLNPSAGTYKRGVK